MRLGREHLYPLSDPTTLAHGYPKCTDLQSYLQLQAHKVWSTVSSSALAWSYVCYTKMSTSQGQVI